MSDGFRVATLVCLGGMFGGLLYWTSLFIGSVSSPEDRTKSFLPTKLFCVEQLFTGMGGAWTVLLATLCGKRASTAATLEDELQLFAGSIVAGYAGNRLLPLVADQLTRQLLKDAERNTARNALKAQQSELTSEVYTYLDLGGSQSSHQTEKYEKKLKAEIKRDPTNRKAVILLARLYAELQKLPNKAIEVLEAFVKSKLAGGKRADGDVADVYWNIANYYEELFKTGGGSDRKLRDAAIDAVVHSIEVMPGYLEILRDDADFAELRDDPETKKKLPATKA